MKSRNITRIFESPYFAIVLLIMAIACSIYACSAKAMPSDSADVIESTEEVSKTHPIPEDEWNEEVRMWLARSVLGEAGWNRFEEQAAVAWVYATRRRDAKRSSFVNILKRYSAAIRRPGKRRNPWLFELTDGLIRPESWPQGPRWEDLHDQSWVKTLDLVDRWFEGEVANPCPGANHFGCYLDAHRAENKRWHRVTCKSRMRNRFYDSRRLRPKIQRSYRTHRRYQSWKHRDELTSYE